MKMAKLQKATLDPTKISGRCGRLKCCLRYEYDTYVELQKELPPVGSEIVTADGKARVLGQEILAQQLLVEMEDNRRLLIEAQRGAVGDPPRRQRASPRELIASAPDGSDTTATDHPVAPTTTRATSWRPTSSCAKR